MILDLDRTTLEMTRGDTFVLPLPLNRGSREYFEKHELTDNEYIYIGIMKPNQPFENASIRCMLDKDSEKDSQGNCVMRLSSEHTVNMNPGKYYLTVKFVRDSDVHTLIDSKIFYILGSNPPDKLR